jgi:hypothetical protein
LRSLTVAAMGALLVGIVLLGSTMFPSSLSSALATRGAPDTNTVGELLASACHPLTDGGTCYEPGEFCRTSDHGVTGVAGDGKTIVCENNDGWRWEPVTAVSPATTPATVSPATSPATTPPTVSPATTPPTVSPATTPPATSPTAVPPASAAAAPLAMTGPGRDLGLIALTGAGLTLVGVVVPLVCFRRRRTG